MSGQKDFALVIQGHHHQTQQPGEFGLTQYGTDESRLELGGHLGAVIDTLSGISVVSLKGNAKISPHIGVEPVDFKLRLGTDSSRQNFYEWLPMGSAGVQLEIRSCRILPLVRAGAGIGNLQTTAWTPQFNFSYGAGFYFNCAGVDFSGAWTRVPTEHPIEFAALDFSFLWPRHEWEFGIRGESQNSEFMQQRVLLSIRGPLLFIH